MFCIPPYLKIKTLIIIIVKVNAVTEKFIPYISKFKDISLSNPPLKLSIIEPIIPEKMMLGKITA